MQLAVSRAEAGISEVLSTIVIIGCQMLEGTFPITGFLLQSTFGHSDGRKLCTYDAKQNRILSLLDVFALRLQSRCEEVPHGRLP